MVHMQSSGATDLSATAGPSSDATIMVTSGPNQNAALRLIDPADSTSSSTFAIFNRGDAVNATLAITDGDNDLLTITDQGDVGAAQRLQRRRRVPDPSFARLERHARPNRVEPDPQRLLGRDQAEQTMISPIAVNFQISAGVSLFQKPAFHQQVGRGVVLRHARRL